MKSFVPWFCLVAVAGSPVSYAINGLEAYRQGNYPLAAQMLAGQSGKDPVADYYLGRMRLYGYGQLKNNTLALRYFTQAAEKGMLPAQQLLARYSLLADKDPEQALYWFKKAAAAGDTQAQMYCAAAYMFGLGTKKNADTARRFYIDAAKAGNAIAQYTLADYFLNSRDQNSKKLGVIWLTKAVAQGSANAQAKLGELYAKGKLVEHDLNKAIELLQKAATQKSLAAMVTLGELAIKQGQIETGKAWLTKAANLQYPEAQIALANFYLDAKSKSFDAKTGFMWMLRAAQNDSSDAQEALATLYKEGKGVVADPQLAEQWQQKAEETESKQKQENPAQAAAQWLTDAKTNNFPTTDYSLSGIYSAWQNGLALKENNYNAAPQMEKITRAELYKPHFVMAHPSEIPINDYFDLIAPTLNKHYSKSWTFPRYPLDAQIEKLQQAESLALRHSERFAAYSPETPYAGKIEPKYFNYIEKMLAGWEQKANYQVRLSQLYNEAILGNSSSQFELGQLYQYGIGVAKNIDQAITYYQLAATQQDIRAEYNLGLLYLEKDKTSDLKEGINWLTDAAFKGNAYAQYVLANIYSKGLTDAKGIQIIKPDNQQAVAMYYLASANGYGQAEYQLADYLVKKKQFGLSVAAKQNRTRLIRRLYEGAMKEGVAEAELPLAFYNAIDPNPKKQSEAFAVAKREAKAGNSEAALLLGMMLERGIATNINPVEAMFWFQQAPLNPANAFILGTYYSLGTGLNKDLVKGKDLLKKAAEAGFSYADLNLAVLKQQTGEVFIGDLNKARQLGNSTAGLLLADYYLAQANNPSTMQQAHDIYQYFADKGDKEAQLKLGFLYDTGLGGQLNRELAAKWYEASAGQGNAVAQFLLGQLYQLGRIGQQPDYEEAKKWYSAAKPVYTKAAVALGFIYDTVEDSYLKAFDNYQLAAQKGDAVGEYDLALLYDKGKGIPVNYVKARELYAKAAEQGYSKAMTQLADLYFKGLGGERNQQIALELYKKAAAIGDSDASYHLGLLSETGIATKLDFPNAVNYYHQAAAKGNEKAKLAMARMYQYGLGVKQDIEQAKSLYNELATNNNAYAQYQLALLELNNSGERKSEAGRKLLRQASENGSLQARKMLQWLEAQQQERVSYIEPIVMNQMPVLAGQGADQMYFDALSEWNRGDEDLSRLILNRLMTQFPKYVPAKRAYEQLIEHTNLVTNSIANRAVAELTKDNKPLKGSSEPED